MCRHLSWQGRDVRPAGRAPVEYRGGSAAQAFPTIAEKLRGNLGRVLEEAALALAEARMRQAMGYHCRR